MRKYLLLMSAAPPRRNPGFPTDLSQIVQLLNFPSFTIGLILVATLTITATGATTSPPAVALSTGTIYVPKTQSLTLAHYNSVTSIDVATIDSWMTAGTSALEVKNSTTDVACPVILSRSGAYGSFGDSGGFSLDVINSTGAYEALRAFTQRVKIVQRITVCGSQTTGGTFNGCSDQGTSTTLGTQMVIASSGSLTSVTLAHEFGHNEGNFDQACGTCTARIMYFQGIAGRNEVTTDECRNFQR